MSTDTTDTFWIADAPIKYEVHSKLDGFRDLLRPGVVIVRYEDSAENYSQAALAIVYDANTIRLLQVDGDMDAFETIDSDQQYLTRNAEHPFNIWRRIWKVALAA